MVIQLYEDFKKMKKFISVMSVFALLVSGYVFAEQDKVSVEVCKEEAKSDAVSADKMKEYIDNCVKNIADDENREQMEVKQEK